MSPGCLFKWRVLTGAVGGVAHSGDVIEGPLLWVWDRLPLSSLIPARTLATG